MSIVFAISEYLGNSVLNMGFMFQRSGFSRNQNPRGGGSERAGQLEDTYIGSPCADEFLQFL